VGDIKFTKITQLVSVTQLNLLSKRDTLRLYSLWSKKLKIQEKLSLMYNLLDNIMDVPSYEFNDFCRELLPYLKAEIPFEDMLGDFQLLKRVSRKFYG
jgi:hypothetical protein